MSDKVTCRYCKKKIDKENAYSVKERVYFCNKSCYDEYYDTECGQLETFLDYIWSLYDVEYRTTEKYMMIRKQAQHYHDEYKFKYKGMLLAAKWYIETLERKWQNQYGLGQILPDRYMQLKHQYEEAQELKKKLKESVFQTNEKNVNARKQPIRRKALSLE